MMIQDIGPHRFINHYDSSKKPKADSPVFYFQGDAFLVKKAVDHHVTEAQWIKEDARAEFDRSLGKKTSSEDRTGDDRCPELVLPTADLWPSAYHFHYLFTIDTIDYFLLSENAVVLPEGYELMNLKQIRRDAYQPKFLVYASTVALQLANWYRDNVYCGRCGHKTVLSKAERAIKCPHCGRTIYPRIVPAVIVAVTKGDKILLTKYSGRKYAYYALIAGFTEIGETMEETVHREVMEEVGLKVKNLRYYKSQPWGIVDDILMGYYCDVDGDDTIKLDTNELKEGVWVDRSEIPGQPDNFSLTNEMMMMFRAGKEPKA